MLKEQIEKDTIEALKNHDENRVSVLRMLKSAIKNQEIQKQTDLADEDVLSVLQNQIKSRRDSISMYEQGARPELAEKEKQEISILSEYLPEQLSEEETKNIIAKVISETGAQGMQDMGKVMSVLMPRIKGKADASLVSKIVKEELNK